MEYIEIPIEEAMRKCKKNAIVLVAKQDLEKNDCNIDFEKKKRNEYDQIFCDVETVASYMDDVVKQLRCFTEKQDIWNIQPKGVQKIVLLRE